MDARRRRIEEPFTRHRIEDARRREQHDVHEPENGHHRGDRDERAAQRSNHADGGVRRDAAARRHPIAAEYVQIRDVDAEIADHDDRDAQGERARNELRRVAHLAGHHVEILPSTNGEEHRHEGRGEPRHERRKLLRGDDRERCRNAIPEHDHAENQCAERNELAHHERVLHGGAEAQAAIVRRGEYQQHRDGDGGRAANRREIEEARDIVRERERDGSGGAARDRRENHPAVHERRALAERAANVDERPSRIREHRAELGEGERARERDEAADHPDREHPAAGRERARDLRGGEEDSATDDAADDDHGGGEEAEIAVQRAGGGVYALGSRHGRRSYGGD